MADIDIEPAFGWVAIVAVIAVLQHQWMWLEVIRARKKYGVAPPAFYAPEDKNEEGNEGARLFNCVQRAHQNCLESLPQFFALLILGGLQHPIVNAVIGLGYIVARFVYFWGYTSGEPQNRYKGMSWIPCIVLMCATTLSFGIQSLLKAD